MEDETSEDLTEYEMQMKSISFNILCLFGQLEPKMRCDVLYNVVGNILKDSASTSEEIDNNFDCFTKMLNGNIKAGCKIIMNSKGENKRVRFGK